MGRSAGEQPAWNRPWEEEAPPGHGVWTGETAAECWAGLDHRPEVHTLDVLFILGAMEGEQPGQDWVLQRPLRAGAGGPEGAGDSWAVALWHKGGWARKVGAGGRSVWG